MLTQTTRHFLTMQNYLNPSRKIRCLISMPEIKISHPSMLNYFESENFFRKPEKSMLIPHALNEGVIKKILT